MSLASRLRGGERPFQTLVRKDGVYFLLTEDNLREIVGIGPPMQNLTKRQSEIFHLVRSGNSNKSIAKLLGISVRTVESHRLAASKKIGAS